MKALGDFLLSCILFIAPCAMASGELVPQEYLILSDQIHNPAADPGNVAPVKNLTFQRDVGTFHLQEGTMYLCKPVSGRVIAAAFMGKGKFSFTPPSASEQGQLRRFFERDSMSESFTFLFLMFGDWTAEELQQNLRFGPGDVPSELNDRLKFSARFLGTVRSSDLDPAFVKTFLEGWKNTLFHAQFSEEKTRPLFFEIDPLQEEGVRFRKRARETVYFVQETVCQFPPNGTLADGTGEQTDFIDILNKTIDATMDDDFDFSATTTVDFRFRQRPQRYVSFFVRPKITIDSVKSATGIHLPFVKDDSGVQVWVRLDSLISPGRPAAIIVFYHGEVIRKGPFSGRIYLDTEIEPFFGIVYKAYVHLWYPRFESRSKPTYDLVFRFPEEYEVIGTGKEVSSSVEGETKVSRWRVDPGAHNVSFGLGKYRKRVVEGSGGPSVTYYEMDEVYRRGLQWDINLASLDIANATKFYENIFGKVPVDRLYAVETPQFHSEAFPGILQISEAASQRALSGFELHRPHEVAHQWWGIGVDPKTYHDQWLAEAFATYSSLLYSQYVLGSSDRFFEALDAWGKLIIENREFFLGGGKEEGPIWLGYRTEGEETRGDQHLIIYLKGAYVLHMLRIMLLDMRSMSENRFLAMMQEFYGQYNGRRASTSDFQKLTEKYAGEPMDWFFDYWIHGTEIPLLKVAHGVQESADGRYTVSCRIRQERVGADFHMSLPVRVRLEDGREFSFRLPVSGSVLEMDLPEFTSRPEEVVFNDMKGILCEMETEDWNQ